MKDGIFNPENLNFKRDLEKLKAKLAEHGINDAIQWEVKRILNENARYKDTLLVFIQLPLSRVYLNKKVPKNTLAFEARSILGIVNEYKMESKREKEYVRRSPYRLNDGLKREEHDAIENTIYDEEYNLTDILNSCNAKY